MLATIVSEIDNFVDSNGSDHDDVLRFSNLGAWLRFKIHQKAHQLKTLGHRTDRNEKGGKDVVVWKDSDESRMGTSQDFFGVLSRYVM